MARRKQRDRVSLPWERRANRWPGPLRNPRWQGILTGVVLLAASVGLVRYSQHRSRVRNTEIAITQLKTAIERFVADVGRCPESDTELLHPPLAQTHYLDAIPKDGWDRPLSVRCPGYFHREAEVTSAGPSGSLTKDDNIP